MRNLDRSDVDFDKALDGLRKEMDTARSGAAADREFGHACRGIGEAFEGRIRVVASTDRLDSIALAPAMTRLPARALSTGVLAAANAALDQARSAMGPLAQTAVDMAALGDQLQSVRDEGVRTMHLVAASLNDTMAQIRHRSGLSGDPGRQGVDQILGALQQAIESVSGLDATAVRGHGTSAGGEIAVSVGATHRLVSVEIGDPALRLPLRDLGAEIVDATNVAFNDLPSAADVVARPRAELADEWRRLQDASVMHMRAYTRALTDLMRSVHGPE